ncbi:hypothetical protein D3C73_925870 [compost metagenome]
MLQRLLGFDGGVDDRFPGRGHVAVDLRLWGLVEIRDIALDEALPVVLVFRRRQWVDRRNRVLVESVFGKQPLEMFVADKHRLGPQFTQGLGDTNAVQGRAETGFRKQGDQFLWVHGEKIRGG